MSDFLLLSDADVELLNRQFGVSLTREAWTRRITMTPSYATLVRSFFDWHVSELAAIALADDRLPAGIDAPDAPFPPAPDRRPPLEAQARLRSARFLLETIRPIREDGEAREARIRLLAEPLPTGAAPGAGFVRRVVYLAGRWYHRPDLMDPDGAQMLRCYLLRAWPEYAGEPVTPEKLRLWRTSAYVIDTVTINSTLDSARDAILN